MNSHQPFAPRNWIRWELRSVQVWGNLSSSSIKITPLSVSVSATMSSRKSIISFWEIVGVSDVLIKQDDVAEVWEGISLWGLVVLSEGWGGYFLKGLIFPWLLDKWSSSCLCFDQPPSGCRWEMRVSRLCWGWCPSDWDLVIWEIGTERDLHLGSLNLLKTL